MFDAKTVVASEIRGYNAVPANSEGCHAEDSLPESTGTIIWFTGLSGAGKTTLCYALAKRLHSRDSVVKVLDADDMRRTLCAGLGYSREGREENIRRIALLAERLAIAGATVLVAAITPYRRMRQKLRERLPGYIEVYVYAPLATCIARDPKGLYRRAMANEIPCFTGISDPYEPPLAADIECDTEEDSVNASVEKMLAGLDCLAKLRRATYVER